MFIFWQFFKLRSLDINKIIHVYKVSHSFFNKLNYENLYYG